MSADAFFSSPDFRLRPGRTFEDSSGRTLRVEQFAGTPTFEIEDEQGKRSLRGVDDLPDWVVRELIEAFASRTDNAALASGDKYDNPRQWLTALLVLRGSRSWGSRSSGGRSIAMTQLPDGPIRYVLSTSEGESLYDNLGDVPGVESFSPEIRKAAESDLRQFQTEERKRSARRRLDMLMGVEQAATPAEQAIDHRLGVLAEETTAGAAALEAAAAGVKASTEFPAQPGSGTTNPIGYQEVMANIQKLRSVFEIEISRILEDQKVEHRKSLRREFLYAVPVGMLIAVIAGLILHYAFHIG